MTEEFQQINYDSMRDCNLKQMLDKSTVLFRIMRKNGVRRLFVMPSIADKMHTSIMFAEPIEDFEKFSSLVANKLMFLLDFGNGFAAKSVLRCEKTPAPIFYESKEMLLTMPQETEFFCADILCLCKDYGGRLDYVQISCGGKTLRVQNQQNDTLNIDEEMTNVRFETVFRFLSMHQRGMFQENDENIVSFAQMLKDEYKEENYFQWANADDDDNPCQPCSDCDECKDESCREKENDEKTCTICMDNKRDAVFQECGHICSCMECSMDLTQCPICQKKSFAIKIFNA